MVLPLSARTSSGIVSPHSLRDAPTATTTHQPWMCSDSPPSLAQTIFFFPACVVPLPVSQRSPPPRSPSLDEWAVKPSSLLRFSPTPTPTFDSEKEREREREREREKRRRKPNSCKNANTRSATHNRANINTNLTALKPRLAIRNRRARED